MNTESYFTREVVTIAPDATLADAAKTMRAHHIGAVVITNQQRPVGILTDRDIAIALGAEARSPTTQVQAFMSCPVVTIGRDQGIVDATRLMRESAARRLPVIDETGRLVGIVSADDLLMLLAQELMNVANGIEAEVLGAIDASA